MIFSFVELSSDFLFPVFRILFPANVEYAPITRKNVSTSRAARAFVSSALCFPSTGVSSAGQ